MFCSLLVMKIVCSWHYFCLLVMHRICSYLTCNNDSNKCACQIFAGRRTALERCKIYIGVCLPNVVNLFYLKSLFFAYCLIEWTYLNTIMTSIFPIPKMDAVWFTLLAPIRLLRNNVPNTHIMQMPLMQKSMASIPGLLSFFKTLKG